MPCQQVTCADYPDKACYATAEECAANCGGSSSSGAGCPAEPCPEGQELGEDGKCACDPPLDCKAPFDLADETKCECNCKTTSVPCGGGRVDPEECACYCPVGKTLNSSGQCVTATYDCNGAGGCAQVAGPGGAYASVDACVAACDGGGTPPPCFPVPLPPHGGPILCPDGTQIGINTYPTFNTQFCQWDGPVPIIWGACDDTPPPPPPPPGSSGTSSSSCDPCGVEPPGGTEGGGTIFGLVTCNGVDFLVLKQSAEGAAGCPTSILQYDHCCVDGPEGCAPQLANFFPSRVWSFNQKTCEWEQKNDAEPPECAGCSSSTSTSSQSSGVLPSSSSTSSTSQSSASSESQSSASSESQSSASSESQSSESQSSASSESQSSPSSSSSSSSSCGATTATSIGFAFSAVNGVPLNQLGPGSQFRVQFAVNNATTAAAANTTWRLYSSAVPLLDILSGAVQPTEAQWTRFVTAADLLDLLGLTFATAESGPYYFPICASTTNCTGSQDVECNTTPGIVTVIVP